MDEKAMGEYRHLFRWLMPGGQLRQRGSDPCQGVLHRFAPYRLSGIPLPEIVYDEPVSQEAPGSLVAHNMGQVVVQGVHEPEGSLLAMVKLGIEAAHIDLSQVLQHRDR